MFYNVISRAMEAQRKVVVFYLDLEAMLLVGSAVREKLASVGDVLLVRYAQSPREGPS